MLLLKCSSFALGALQLRSGFPPAASAAGLGRHSFWFMQKCNTLRAVAFQVFLALPFVYELRCECKGIVLSLVLQQPRDCSCYALLFRCTACQYFHAPLVCRQLLDWSCTSTTLTLMDWFKLEDINTSLYFCTCECYHLGWLPPKATPFLLPTFPTPLSQQFHPVDLFGGVRAGNRKLRASKRLGERQPRWLKLLQASCLPGPGPAACLLVQRHRPLNTTTHHLPLHLPQGALLFAGLLLLLWVPLLLFSSAAPTYVGKKCRGCGVCWATVG